MADVYTTGIWRAKAGHEEQFVEAWTQFARWASRMEGAGEVRLVRDLRDSGRYMSFAPWDAIEHVRAWKASSEFRSRMAAVQEHVAEFAPTEMEVVAAVAGGVETVAV